MCFFRLDVSRKDLSHCAQICDFCLLWFNTWILSFCFDENFFKQSSQANSCSIFDDVGIVFCSKRKLNKNKQTKILIVMHFVVCSNFSSLDLVAEANQKCRFFMKTRAPSRGSGKREKERKLITERICRDQIYLCW